MRNTILLIEDEKKTAQMLKQALESEGIDVVWASDGEQALKAVERGKFDLIILDLKLPLIPGDQVLEGIRRVDPYVEVLVYTNYSDPPVMQKLINLGVEGYIRKGAEADLWDTVARIKAMLDPFSEDERETLLEAVPEGAFENDSRGGAVGEIE